MTTAEKLPIDTSASAMDMAELIFGSGVQVLDASYTGDPASSGIWSHGDKVSPHLTPGDKGVILSTGRASDVTNASGPANANPGTSTDTAGGIDNNASFNAAAGQPTYDASWLDVSFIPEHGMMTIRFTFSSEEYPEYTNSVYNDFVGVWINGQFVEPLQANSIHGVNQTDNSNLYLDNTGGQFNSEMDGFTITMSLTIPVKPGEVNTIRIGIADVADSVYDSNLLIAADSVQTTLVAMTDQAQMVPGGYRTMDVLANDIDTVGGVLTITHINDIPVKPGQTVVLPNGQHVTLNPDMTLGFTGPGTEGASTFTYTVRNAEGETDVGYVVLNTVPCFTPGTLIATPSGPRPVESLGPGDLVWTREGGAEPVLWAASRLVAGDGAEAPVEFSAGALGAHGRLALSPLHRVLVSGPAAELMFGSHEVLVCARDLVNGTSIRQRPASEVLYLHLLLARHRILLAEGMPVESYLPGRQSRFSHGAEALARLCEVLPGFDPVSGTGYPPMGLPMLRRHEAKACAGLRMATLGLPSRPGPGATRRRRPAAPARPEPLAPAQIHPAAWLSAPRTAQGAAAISP